MTVTNKGEVGTGRRGSNKLGKRSYTRVWLVETSSKTEGPYAVGSASGLPAIGDAHPEDANATCKSVEPECVSGWKAWRVTATYDDVYEQDPTTPTNDDIKYSWSTEQFQRPAVVDKDGNAVVNSAGDPYNPPAMRDDSRTICTITVNATTVPTYVLTYPNVVNSDAFTIDGVSVAARYAKISRVGVSELQRRNGTAYRTVTLEMHIRNEVWDFSILDAGFRIIDPSDSTKRISARNDDGTDAAEPVLLDGAGAVLADPDPSTAVFNSHRVYSEAAYIGNIPGCA